MIRKFNKYLNEDINSKFGLELTSLHNSVNGMLKDAIDMYLYGNMKDLKKVMSNVDKAIKDIKRIIM